MKICKTNIVFEQDNRSLNGEITAESPLALDQNGAVSEAQADILLKLDDKGELVILKNSANSVVLERNGRRLTLSARPIRICEKDIIHIENSRLCIARSTFAVTKPSRKFGTASRVLAASAALCSLALTACEESCDNGQVKCDSNAIYECKDNSWTLKQKCNLDLHEECSIHDNQAECVSTTEPGSLPDYDCWGDESKCEDNKIYVCQNHEWQLETDCGSGLTCEMRDNEAVCVGVDLAGVLPAYECVMNETQCRDNVVYTCEEGRWSKLNDCNDIPGASCEMLDNKAQCVLQETSGTPLPPEPVCDDGAYKCEDNVAIVCKDGDWYKSEDCNDVPNATCQMVDNKAQCLSLEISGDIAPDPITECKDDESKCENNSIYICAGGLWIRSRECKGMTECVETPNGAMCIETPTSGIMPPEPDPEYPE